MCIYFLYRFFLRNHCKKVQLICYPFYNRCVNLVIHSFFFPSCLFLIFILHFFIYNVFVEYIIEFLSCLALPLFRELGNFADALCAQLECGEFKQLRTFILVSPRFTRICI